MRPTVLLALLLSLASSAPAAACEGSGGYSPCVDANALWLRSGPGGFVAVPAASAVPRARVAFGVAAVLLVRPLVLEVPSPDPEGREVRLVDFAIDESVLVAAGLGGGVELGLALTSVLYQRGSGSAGIRSQDGPALSRATERDPRLSLAWSAPLGERVALKPRFDLALPFGDDGAYASDGAVVAAPGVSAAAGFGRFALGALAGVRLRRSVDVGPLRWGSQAELALAAGFRLFERPNLSLALEAFALPSLVDATSARGKAQGLSVTSVPAEWLAHARVQPDADAPWFIAAGAGGGLALSAEERAGARRAHFGATTPELRALLSVHYAPER